MKTFSKGFLSLIAVVCIAAMIAPLVSANVVELDVAYEREKVRLMAKYEDGTTDTATRGATRQRVRSEEERIKQLQLAEKTRLTLHQNIEKGMSAQEALDSLSAGSVIAITNQSCVAAGGNPSDCLSFYSLDGSDLFGHRGDSWTEVMNCEWTSEEYEFKSLDPWFHILNANQIITHNQVLVLFGATTYYRVHKTGTCEQWEVGPEGPITKIGDVSSQAQEDGHTDKIDAVAMADEMTEDKVRVITDAGDGRMILLFPTSYEEFHLVVDVTLDQSLFGERIEKNQVVKKYLWEERDEGNSLRIVGSSPGGGTGTPSGRFPGR